MRGSCDAAALPLPACDLDEPGTILFTSERALAGRALNRFALSLRAAQARDAFLADEGAYMARYDLTPSVQAAVRKRDWTALLYAGGHLQAILKLAATVGESLWHIGAHNVGTDVGTLQAACPRHVDFLPSRS
ncbi:protocatechuate 4,5-dioxygenase alpha subunit [Chitinasiproducens palmae]|uniref:Protocatechuate 4,5-dioxygenase alpha subunit n=2 Tax=Chitinasiproducens palmae TaxID=1770053 RepID=A0A1H2PS06_9BURK|nr:protocatechuate 4,5-dioxygenase alpha subunit [Chitinasiproducens palmae]